jgi:hypothetical protein
VQHGPQKCFGKETKYKKTEISNIWIIVTAKKYIIIEKVHGAQHLQEQVMYQIQRAVSVAILMAVLAMANNPVPETTFNSSFQPIEAAQAAAP